MRYCSVCVLFVCVVAVAAIAQGVDPKAATREGIERRITADIDSVRQSATEAKIANRERKRLLKELDALAKQFESAPPEFGDDFRTILPFNALHARVFGAQAALWKAQGCAPLTVWQADVWGNLTPWQAPAAKSAPEIDVRMMANEYRAGAFNVSNASPEAVALKLRIVGLPGAPGTSGGENPGYVTVHQVEWTDTKTGRVVAAALPEAIREGGDYMINVPSGLTRQVWLTFHPVDLPAGTYKGRIELRAGSYAFDVPLALQVYPLRFPDQPALHFGGWDYSAAPGIYGVTESNIEAFLKHCREHFVDSPWEGSKVIPPGAYDKQGNIVTEPDTSIFDTWIARWPNARRLCVFPNLHREFCGLAMGTPEFETAVKNYVTFWANHAAKKGFEPEHFVWLLIDEPREIKTDEIIVAWAKIIHAANTGIQIWEDPIHSNMSDAHPELGSACDILCPNRTIFLGSPEKYAQYFIEQHEKGKTLEFYSCRGPARLLDPYAYHRMQAWSCWQYGAISTNFWALGDNAGISSWNEYLLKRPAYTPFFIDATSITAGKHMEAIRESIEDYEYLVMLGNAVKEAETSGRQDEPVKRARILLDEVPGRVLNAETLKAFFWRDKCDRTVADKARVEVLDALVALK